MPVEIEREIRSIIAEVSGFEEEEITPREKFL